MRRETLMVVLVAYSVAAVRLKLARLSSDLP
ncbi:MAG: hypothetical protein JWO76_3219 [Nocardioides sp.]|nr:hypothetical protein [Nocardioides sp.]